MSGIEGGGERIGEHGTGRVEVHTGRVMGDESDIKGGMSVLQGYGNAFHRHKNSRARCSSAWGVTLPLPIAGLLAEERSDDSQKNLIRKSITRRRGGAEQIILLRVLRVSA